MALEQDVYKLAIDLGESEAKLQKLSNQIDELEKKLNKPRTLPPLKTKPAEDSVKEFEKKTISLNSSVAQISRELPAAAVGLNTFFLGISNNIPMLANNINMLKEQNKALIASGRASETTSVWKELGSAVFSWNTVISISITLITIYGEKMVEYIGNLFKSKSALDLNTEAMKLYNDYTGKMYDKTKDLNEAIEREIFLQNLKGKTKADADYYTTKYDYLQKAKKAQEDYLETLIKTVNSELNLASTAKIVKDKQTGLNAVLTDAGVAVAYLDDKMQLVKNPKPLINGISSVATGMATASNATGEYTNELTDLQRAIESEGNALTKYLALLKRQEEAKLKSIETQKKEVEYFKSSFIASKQYIERQTVANDIERKRLALLPETIDNKVKLLEFDKQIADFELESNQKRLREEIEIEKYNYSQRLALQLKNNAIDLKVAKEKNENIELLTLQQNDRLKQMAYDHNQGILRMESNLIPYDEVLAMKLQHEAEFLKKRTKLYVESALEQRKEANRIENIGTDIDKLNAQYDIELNNLNRLDTLRQNATKSERKAHLESLNELEDYNAELQVQLLEIEQTQALSNLKIIVDAKRTQEQLKGIHKEGLEDIGGIGYDAEDLKNKEKIETDYSNKINLIYKKRDANQDRNNKEFQRKEKDNLKQLVKTYADYFGQISTAIIGIFNAINEASIKHTDLLISQQEKRIDTLTKAQGDGLTLAEKGNAKMLELERQRLQDLHNERAKAVKQQQQLNTLQIISDTAVMVAKAASEGGVAAAVTIAVAMAGLIAGLISARSVSSSAGYFKGGETEGGYTGDGSIFGQSTKLGNKPYIYHNKEFVMNNVLTSRYLDIFRDVHAGKVDLRDWKMKSELFDRMSFKDFRGREFYTSGGSNGVNIAPLLSEIKGLRSELTALKFGLNVDESGFTTFMQKRVKRKENIKQSALLVR